MCMYEGHAAFRAFVCFSNSKNTRQLKFDDANLRHKKGA